MMAPSVSYLQSHWTIHAPFIGTLDISPEAMLVISCLRLDRIYAESQAGSVLFHKNAMRLDFFLAV